jgi:hypothetical protein
VQPITTVLSYGQSLSVGNQVGTIEALTTVQSHGNMMIAGGLRQQYDGVAYAPTSLVPLVEQVSPAYPAVFGETPVGGMTDMLSKLILAEDGAAAYAAHKFAGSAPGHGSTAIAGLVKGTAPWGRMTERLFNVSDLAWRGGSAASVGCMTWLQGETDYLLGTVRATYAAALAQMAAAFADTCQRCNPQTTAPFVIVGQIASHLYAPTATPSIALAQLDAITAAPTLLALGPPLYLLDYVNDWHPTAQSFRWLGGYFGLVAKRWIFDNDRTFSAAVRITAAVRNGDGIDVTTDAEGQLTIDTTWVTALADGNYGVQVVDSGGSPVVVTGVTVVGTNGLRVACLAGGGAGSKVRTGWAGTAGQTCPGRLTGARTNLRDAYGDTIDEFEIETGDDRKMHRWMAIQEVTTA